MNTPSVNSTNELMVEAEEALMRGNNQGSLQKMNRFLVVRIVSSRGVCSRAEIAKVSGLQQATITYIVGDLLKRGILRETGKMEGGSGRKSIGLEINPDAFRVLGVRLTRNHFYVGVFNLAGQLCSDLMTERTNAKTPQQVMQGIKATCKTLQESFSDILATGVSLPGPLSTKEGRIVQMTESPGWENVYIQEDLENCLGHPVILIHDAKAGVMAEWWFGDHRSSSGTIVYIAAGQGIGCGVLIDGKLFEGQQGFAGEIGHMSICFDGPQCSCGNHGCLELYCSTIALRKLVQKNLSHYPTSCLDENSSLSEIHEAISAGDQLACDMYRQVADKLGLGLISIVNAFNPGVIIVGDELSKNADILLPIIEDKLRRGVSKTAYDKLKVEASKLPMDPAFHGAGAAAVQHVLQDNAD